MSVAECSLSCRLKAAAPRFEPTAEYWEILTDSTLLSGYKLHLSHSLTDLTHLTHKIHFAEFLKKKNKKIDGKNKRVRIYMSNASSVRFRIVSCQVCPLCAQRRTPRRYWTGFVGICDSWDY